MSRLTERDGRIAVRVGGCTKRNDPVFEKLANYEDLEEAGRLITLPCKVGDAVWIVVKTDDGYEIQKDFVASICVQRHGNFGIEMRFADTISTIMLSYIPMKAFGEVVFLTKAEAERKLAEIQKGGDE